MSEAIAFSRRRVDWPIVSFFAVNLLFITYVVDLEQLVIADPAHFTYPLWPPAPMVDLIHSYGRTFDPLLMARPVWWKMTILLDSVFFWAVLSVWAVRFCAGPLMDSRTELAL